VVLADHDESNRGVEIKDCACACVGSRGSIAAQTQGEAINAGVARTSNEAELCIDNRLEFSFRDTILGKHTSKLGRQRNLGQNY
jgi:hypothetical protein